MLCEVELHAYPLHSQAHGRAVRRASLLRLANGSGTGESLQLSHVRKPFTIEQARSHGTAMDMPKICCLGVGARTGPVPFATSFSLKPTARCHHRGVTVDVTDFAGVLSTVPCTGLDLRAWQQSFWRACASSYSQHWEPSIAKLK